MAIRRARWNGHSALGDLELDFRRDNDQAFRTIVIAGENGVGKTSILDSLSRLGESVIPELHDLSFIEIDEPGVGFAQVSHSGERHTDLKGALFNESGEEITGESDKSRYLFNVAEGVLGRFRLRGIAYSRVRSGFRVGLIDSITTGERDWGKAKLDDSDDYTPVKQMLVNLRTQDDREFAQIAMQQDMVSWKAFYPRSKVCRFASSLNAFFDELAFDRVAQIDSYHQVLFKKHGCDIPIDALSTGEKQIVYRGSYLLDALENNEGGVVLVDEPELSMHPKWQQRILDYYRGLFPLGGDDPVQLIVATHSEYVLEAALNDPEGTLVIALEDKGGVIVPNRITAPYAPESLSASEVNYRVFGIASTDYHVALYGLMQSFTQAESVVACDRFIAGQPAFDESRHARVSKHGATEYRTLPTFIRNAIDHPDSGNRYSHEELVVSIELMQEIALRLRR